jgi:hypothetical protein
MRCLGYLVLLATSCGVVSCQLGEAPDELAELAPQVRPVFTWLTAVKAGDQELFKTAVSERLQAQFEKSGWDQVVGKYQESFTQVFGDYKVGDFTLGFEGGADEGTVSVKHPKMEPPGLRVIKENGAWKIDEL